MQEAGWVLRTWSVSTEVLSSMQKGGARDPFYSLPSPSNHHPSPGSILSTRVPRRHGRKRVDALVPMTFGVFVVARKPTNGINERGMVCLWRSFWTIYSGVCTAPCLDNNMLLLCILLCERCLNLAILKHNTSWEQDKASSVLCYNSKPMSRQHCQTRCKDITSLGSASPSGGNPRPPLLAPPGSSSSSSSAHASTLTTELDSSVMHWHKQRILSLAPLSRSST